MAALLNVNRKGMRVEAIAITQARNNNDLEGQRGRTGSKVIRV